MTSCLPARREEVVAPPPDPLSTTLAKGSTTLSKVRPVGSACARHRAPPRYTKYACGRTLTDHRTHQRAGERQRSADAGFARNAVFSFFQCPVVTDLLSSAPSAQRGRGTEWRIVPYAHAGCVAAPAWLRPECPPPGEFVCLCVSLVRVVVFTLILVITLLSRERDLLFVCLASTHTALCLWCPVRA